MKSYDVVIVGAGPGGLNCAEKLAKSGKTVLLLEQNKVVGPKICAGGLISSVLKYLGIPDRLLDCKLSGFILHTPHNKVSIKLNEYVGTIDRKKLGQWQLKKLRKTSAVVKTGARVTKICKDYVIVNNSENVKFKYLVGADGSTSIVRRYLGLKTDFTLAFQYIVPAKKYKKPEIFFDSKLFSAHYAYIFPHKGYAAIGIGGNPKIIPAGKLQQNFHKWLESENIDVSKAKYQAYPINTNYLGCRFSNIFLVGDAAGFASELTGGGIYQALVSGEEIARMIADKNYKSRKIDELLKVKKSHRQILNIIAESGPFRAVEYELGALLFKNKEITKKIIKSI